MGTGYAQTIYSKYNGFERISCLANFVFFMFLRSFWVSFLLILVVLGRHFGSQKVDVNFDRKTGMELNPGIPGRRVQIPQELSTRPPLDSKAPGGTPHRG